MKSYNFIEKLYEWTFYEKKKRSVRMHSFFNHFSINMRNQSTDSRIFAIASFDEISVICNNWQNVKNNFLFYFTQIFYDR